MAGRESRARPSGRWRAAALAALTALTALQVAAPAAARTTAPILATTSASSPGASGTERCARASNEAPLQVEVATLTPRAPVSADESFQVTGRLVNCGPEPLADLELRLGVGPRIATRSGLARADVEPTVGSTRLADDPARTGLGDGASTTFDLRLSVGELRLGTRNGVFPLTLQARARVGDEPRTSQVGLAWTFVPWLPDGPIAPTRIAWVLPLVDQPRQAPNEALLDDGLEALLADGGRLQQVLEAGATGRVGACDDVAPPARPPEPEPLVPGPLAPEPLAPEPLAPEPLAPALPCRGEPVPLTYAVDPDLVGTVETMTRPYPVLRGGEPVEQPALPTATAWLAQLRAELAATPGGDAAQLLALPYADPDVVAMTRTGSPMRDEVEALRRLGQSEARRLLAAEPASELMWLPPGPLGGAVDVLAGGQVQTLLLDPSSLPPLDPTSGRTPSARTTLPSTTDPVSALVLDEALSALAEPDPDAPGWQGARLAEQRWIAEAAAITAERPSTSRTLVVAPRREAELHVDVASAVIADTGRVAWLCPVALTAAAAGTEQCVVLPDDQGPAASEPRGVPLVRDEDSDDDQDELDRDDLEALGVVRTAADQFTDHVLVPGTEATVDTKGRLLRARGRVASQAWRDTPGGQLQLRLLREEVLGLRSLVRLISQPVTLTGSSGTIRLVVQNELEQPINVGVGLPRNPAARLESDDTALRVVPGRQAVQVSIQVDVRTSGRFIVRATLVDAEGRAFGDAVELPVRSTQYGRFALALTGLAAAVLLVTVGARILRRATGRGTRGTPA